MCDEPFSPLIKLCVAAYIACFAISVNIVCQYKSCSLAILGGNGEHYHGCAKTYRRSIAEQRLFYTLAIDPGSVATLQVRNHDLIVLLPDQCMAARNQRVLQCQIIRRISTNDQW